jgi:penicillin-binding protein-related factor A (putative recombinase)
MNGQDVTCIGKFQTAYLAWKVTTDYLGDFEGINLDFRLNL